jgi:hypothetical protein
MNRSNCASGSGYVPSCSIGFCVASTDRHLALLHRFEQRALDLGGGAVDLVGQDDVGEDRALARVELPVALAVDLGSDKIGGQEVGSELNPAELRVDGLGQHRHRQRLGQARDALQQDVPVGQQADQHPFEHVPLAHDDLVHLAQQRPHELAAGLDHLADLLDICRHKDVPLFANDTR